MSLSMSTTQHVASSWEFLELIFRKEQIGFTRFELHFFSNHNRFALEIPIAEWQRAAKVLKEQLGYEILIDYSLIKRGPTPLLQLLLQNVLADAQVVLQATLTTTAFPTLRPIFKLAEALEMQIAEQPRALSAEYPLTLGPYQALVTGGAQYSGRLEKRKLSALSVHHHFAGQMWSELLQASSWQSGLIHLMKMNPQNRIVPMLAWTLGRETMSGIVATPATQAFRMMLYELARMQEHTYAFLRLFLFYRKSCAIGLTEAILRHLSGLFETLTGHIWGVPAFIGPAQYDETKLSPANFAVVRSHLRSCERLIWQVWKLLQLMPLVRRQLRHGEILPDQVDQWALDGLHYRACGISYDQRRHRPFYLYGEMDVQVPLGASGCGRDRFEVRYAEFKESIRLVRHLMNHFPQTASSSVSSSELPVHDQSFAAVLESVQVDEAKPWYQSASLPKEPFLHLTTLESGQGSFHLLWQGQVGSTPSVRVLSPHYNLLQATTQLWLHRSVREFMAGLLSCNVVANEVNALS